MALASCYITSARHYHPSYKIRSSMYIRGLIPRNFAELAEAVPIAFDRENKHYDHDQTVPNSLMEQSYLVHCNAV